MPSRSAIGLRVRLQRLLVLGLAILTLAAVTSAQGTIVTDVIALPAPPIDVVIGDVDGDLLPDVIAISKSTADVRIILADGLGGYALQGSPPQTLGAATGNERLAAADLDGDGDLDLVVVNRDDGTLSLFDNDGAGSFTVTSIDLNTVLGASLAPAHPTGVLALSGSPGEVWVTTAGSPFVPGLSALVRIEDPLVTVSLVVSDPVRGGSFTSLTVADVDRDGNLDIVAANASTGVEGGLHFLLSDGAGTFLPMAPIVPAAGQGVLDVQGATLDGTGTLDDLIMASVPVSGPGGPFSGTGAVSILVNDGVGGFAEDTLRTSFAGRQGVAGNFAGDPAIMDVIEVQSVGSVRGHLDFMGSGPILEGSFDLPGALGSFTGPDAARLRAGELDATTIGACTDRDELVIASQTQSQIYIVKFESWFTPADLISAGAGDVGVTITFPGGDPLLPNPAFAVGVTGGTAFSPAVLVVQDQTAAVATPTPLAAPVVVIIDFGQPYLIVPVTLDVTGQALVPLGLPDEGSLGCLRFALQWAVYDGAGANGISVSDGALVSLGFL